MLNFSFSLAQNTRANLNVGQKNCLTRMIAWMLQQHLLIQLHNYVTLVLTDDVKTDWTDPIVVKFKNKKKGPVYVYEFDKIDRLNVVPKDPMKFLEEEFSEEDREIIMKVPAASNPDDLAAFCQVRKQKDRDQLLPRNQPSIHFPGCQMVQRTSPPGGDHVLLQLEEE